MSFYTVTRRAPAGFGSLLSPTDTLGLNTSFTAATSSSFGVTKSVPAAQGPQATLYQAAATYTARTAQQAASTGGTGWVSSVDRPQGTDALDAVDERAADAADKADAAVDVIVDEEAPDAGRDAVRFFDEGEGGATASALSCVPAWAWGVAGLAGGALVVWMVRR